MIIKLIGSLVQICNEETNSCLSANKSGQVVLTKDVGIRVYMAPKTCFSIN